MTINLLSLSTNYTSINLRHLHDSPWSTRMRESLHDDHDHLPWENPFTMSDSTMREPFTMRDPLYQRLFEGTIVLGAPLPWSSMIHTVIKYLTTWELPPFRFHSPRKPTCFGQFARLWSVEPWPCDLCCCAKPIRSKAFLEVTRYATQCWWVQDVEQENQGLNLEEINVRYDMLEMQRI